MSYIADFKGFIKLSATADLDRLDYKLNYLVDEDYKLEEKSVITEGNNEYRWINVTLEGYANYDEADWYRFFEEFEADTVYGQIYFTGEDHQHWRFIYKDNPAKNKFQWIEQQGRIVYGEEVQ